MTAPVTVYRNSLSAEPSLDPQNARDPEDDEPIRELEIPLGFSTLKLVEYGNGDVSVANGGEFCLIEGDYLYQVAEFLIGKRAATLKVEQLTERANELLRDLEKA